MEIAFAPSITSFIPKKIDQISVQSGLEAQLDIFLTLLFRLDELVNVTESQNCSDNEKNSDPNGKASPGYVSGSSRTETRPAPPEPHRRHSISASLRYNPAFSEDSCPPLFRRSHWHPASGFPQRHFPYQNSKLWSLCEIRTFLPNGGSRSSIWVQWSEVDVSYEVPSV